MRPIATTRPALDAWPARACRALLAAIASAGLLAMIACALPTAALSAPVTGWGIESTHAPTNLPPGGEGEYALNVYNNGALPSSGTVTVTDRLPDGVTTAATPHGGEWSCAPTGAGHSVFNCTTSQIVYADGVAEPIEVPVHVPDVNEGSVLTNNVSVSGGGAPRSASDSERASVSATPASFGIQSLSAEEYDEEGQIYTQAGGHPYAATATWRFNTVPRQTPLGGLGYYSPEYVKDIEVELPPGIIGNPAATPRCFSFGSCPPASQVGMIYINLQGFKGVPGGTAGYAIFNMVPPAGMAAQFKFQTLEPTVTIDARVRSDGNYGLTVYSEDISEFYAVNGVRVTLWGTPADPSHDWERKTLGIGRKRTPTNSPVIPFVSNPTDCASEAAAPPVTVIKTDSWQHPGAFSEASSIAPAVTGCGALSFEPTIAFAPEATQAGQPTGYGFTLRVPQSETAGAPAVSELRDAAVSLPAGMGVSPSATGGLSSCSPAQIGLRSLAAGECPSSSEVATVAIWTPLLSTQPSLQLTGAQRGELECAPGSWDGEQAGYPLRYQWLRDGVPISGAQSTVYLPGAADEGQAIQCEVIASNAAGSTAAVSAGETIAPYPSPLPPQVVLQPRVEGAAAIGATLTCTSGSWAGEPSAYAYQWLRAGQPIAGAQASAYTLTAADSSQTVQCEVSASNAGGSEIAMSVAAGTVAPAPASAPPLLEPPLTGRVYVAQPECSPCSASQVAEGKLLGLYIEAEGKGVRVKLPGSVAVNPLDGQLTARFDENPRLPFEELQLHFKNGPRAPLANPQTCGTYAATSSLQPWSAPDLADATPSSSFAVSFDGAGAACPASLPFSPSFAAGTTSPAARGFSDFDVTFGRPVPAHESEERSEQDFYGVQVHTPPGLLGMVSKVPLCGEPQASQGTCSAESQIGTTTIATGPGSHPLQLEGQVYLTTGYKGAPYGLSIVVPAEAGPFKLAGTTGRGTVVVRAAINIDPTSAALTITSDPLPRIVDGVILRLAQAHIHIDRPGFIFNATDCTPQSITATLTGAQGAKDDVSAPYNADGCASLPFKPSFSMFTRAKTSRRNGASLTVKVGYPKEGEANIKRVKVELPKRLPSRLTTLQKACVAATFESDPAACPPGSVVGTVRARTPVLPDPLTGPVYFVSHGGEAFPSLIVVLQADGVRIDLTGQTFINEKSGITSSTFATVPDAPVSSFVLKLPEGPSSALAAPSSLCRKRGRLIAPTIIEGQNGKRIEKRTKIKVTGCAKRAKRKAHGKHKRAQGRHARETHRRMRAQSKHKARGTDRARRIAAQRRRGQQ